MKRIFLTVAFVALFAASTAQAQRDALIDHTDKWNLNTRFDAGFTDLGEDSAVLGGMSIGGLLNDSFGLGLHARALANSVEAGPVVGPVDQMDFWYGGLFLEYVLGAENLVYLSGDLTLAYGELSSAMRDTDFYVAEPAINLNINITETLMFGIGASYRSVSGTDAVGLEDSDLSEMAWNISLRFTQF